MHSRGGRHRAVLNCGGVPFVSTRGEKRRDQWSRMGAWLLRVETSLLSLEGLERESRPDQRPVSPVSFGLRQFMDDPLDVLRTVDARVWLVRVEHPDSKSVLEKPQLLELFLVLER